MQLLSKAIHGILTADTDITDTVGSGNIWHSKIPQRTTSGSDAPVPISIYFYTYAVNPTGSTKTGRAELDEHMIRVCIVGSDDENMYEVARYVRYALDRITPGTYSGIPIQGIDFLNASFDPEGSYELENQSWVLEFKVRVIDSDIRTPSGPAPSFANQSWNYSIEEQIWPYSKYLGTETIYWKTFNVGLVGQQKTDVQSPLYDEIDRFIHSEVHATDPNTEDKYTESIYRIQANGASDLSLYWGNNIPETVNDIQITIWYTKT